MKVYIFSSFLFSIFGACSTLQELKKEDLKNITKQQPEYTIENLKLEHTKGNIFNNRGEFKIKGVIEVENSNWKIWGYNIEKEKKQPFSKISNKKKLDIKNSGIINAFARYLGISLEKKVVVTNKVNFIFKKADEKLKRFAFVIYLEPPSEYAAEFALYEIKFKNISRYYQFPSR